MDLANTLDDCCLDPLDRSVGLQVVKRLMPISGPDSIDRTCFVPFGTQRLVGFRDLDVAVKLGSCLSLVWIRLLVGGYQAFKGPSKGLQKALN